MASFSTTPHRVAIPSSDQTSVPSSGISCRSGWSSWNSSGNSNGNGIALLLTSDTGSLSPALDFVELFGFIARSEGMNSTSLSESNMSRCQSIMVPSIEKEGHPWGSLSPTVLGDGLSPGLVLATGAICRPIRVIARKQFADSHLSSNRSFENEKEGQRPSSRGYKGLKPRRTTRSSSLPMSDNLHLIESGQYPRAIIIAHSG